MASPYTITVKLDVQDRAELERMIKQLNQLAGQAPKAQEAMEKTSRGFKKTQIEARKTGRVVQNVGYQFQDMIIQISGGVDPLRSISQQLPQMIVGFGAWGAVIGLVAAGLPVLIQSLTATGDEMKSLNDLVKEAEESLSRVGRTIKDTDTSKFVQEWNNANEVMKGVLETMNAVNIEMAKRTLSGAGTQAADELRSVIGGGGQFGGGFFPDIESAGLTGTQYSAIFNLIQEMKEAEPDIDAMNESLAQLGTNFEGVDRAVLTQINNLQAAVEAYKELTDWQEATAELGVQSALDRTLAENDYRQMVLEVEQLEEAMYNAKVARQQKLNEAEARKAAAAAARAQAEALRELQAAYQALYPAQAKFFDQVKTANTQLEAGLITYEEYILRTQAAADNLGLVGDETQKIADGFAEAAAIGRDSSNNNIVEQATLAQEAVELFNDSFDTMLDGVLMGTQDISQGFEDMAKVIIAQLAKIAATQGIAALLGGSGNTFLQSVGSALASAKGNAFSGGNVIPMANGGIVNGPTLFPMANGAGLMGEAGPEAVMPLGRDSQGRLGVYGGGMNVTVNNNAAGVEVNPRQTEEGLTIDVVMANVAANVRRGGNVVAEAFEQTYSVGRGRGVY